MGIEVLGHVGRVVPDWLVHHKPRSVEEYADYVKERGAKFVALTVRHEVGRRLFSTKGDFFLNLRSVTADNKQFGFEQRIGENSGMVREEDESRILLQTCGIAKAIEERIPGSRVIVLFGRHNIEYGNGDKGSL